MLIHNCDTGFRWRPRCLEEGVDAWMPVFEVAGEHYIAPLLHAMLSHGYSVSLPQVEGVQLYGTPGELCATFGISLNALLEENR